MITYLTDVLTRIKDHPIDRLEDLLPWNMLPASSSPQKAGYWHRSMHIYTIENVAVMICENLELLREISANSDDIDYGEMVYVHNETEDGTTGFTDRGVECLEELLADIRTWEGGIRKFLVDEKCDPERIERIMADEPER